VRALTLLLLFATGAAAMDVRVAGNLMYLTGGIDGSELARMRDVLPANPRIDTVVLTSSGGDIWTAMRLGELFTERRFKTAVSGQCSSACVIAFLGGVERVFANGADPGRTYLAIHTPTFSGGWARDMQGSVANRWRGEMFNWMRPRVKDAALLERGLGNDDPRGMLYLYDLRLVRQDGVAVFQCAGHEARKVADCATIKGTDALRAGFITSAEILEIR